MAHSAPCWCTINTFGIPTAHDAYFSRGRGGLAIENVSQEACPHSYAANPTLSGPGTSTPNCSSSGCAFPDPSSADLDDGRADFTISCSVVEFDGDEQVIIDGQDTITLTIDNSPPNISFGNAPPQGSTLPFASFQLHGKVTDASSVVSLQESFGIPIVVDGEDWSINLTTAIIPTSGILRVTLVAQDLLGNSTSTSRMWYFDGVPPTIAFSTDSFGSQRQISTIHGTASDNYKLDRILLKIREDATGRYWDGSQFVSQAATLEVPVSHLPTAAWEYTGLDSDQLKSDADYSITATALDFFQMGTVLQAQLSLATVFLGEGVVADMFNGSLVQFLVSQNDYVSYGQSAQFCVHYASPTLRSRVHFEVYPPLSVVLASAQSIPNAQCPGQDELIEIRSIVPINDPVHPGLSKPPIVTDCVDQTEIRAFIDSQIVGRVKLDIVTPKSEFAEITSFRNDLSIQTPPGIPYASACPSDPPGTPPNQRVVPPYCMGYWHKVYVSKGPNESRSLDMPAGTILTESVYTAPATNPCTKGTIVGSPPITKTGGLYYVDDFNGFGTTKTSTRFPNCNDLKVQSIQIGKCAIGSVSIFQSVRNVNGNNFMYMSRSDRNPGSLQYPPTPP